MGLESRFRKIWVRQGICRCRAWLAVHLWHPQATGAGRFRSVGRVWWADSPGLLSVLESADGEGIRERAVVEVRLVGGCSRRP